VEQWSLVAHNTSTASENKIHDDAVARSFGFAGGLVPGVDVYAYLTHVPAAAWGRPWLERGTMRARFLQPVYDGERVDVVPARVDSARVVLELRNEAGDVCATGEATLPAAAPEPVDVAAWADVPPRAERPVPSAESLAPGTALALEPHGFHADRHGEYLDDVRETLPLYAGERAAHPGWLLRDANYVLSRNVRLGPWIHVESRAQHHGVAADGDRIVTRAVVTAEWERKGHRFVELDVIVLADGTCPIARIAHTAIYRPRQAS
jgi:hypothetical protein